MKLKTHIKRSGLSICDWSAECGLNHVTIRKAIKGDYSIKTAKAIYAYTDGKVRLPIKRINPYEEN